MFSLLLSVLISFSPLLAQTPVCQKATQVEVLQKICDEASKPPTKSCEMKSVSPAVNGGTVQFGIFTANGKIKGLLEKMNRQTLQNSLPTKCEPPCISVTATNTVLKVKPTKVNTSWQAEEDNDCTSKYFNKTMTATKTFKLPKSGSCRESLQGTASGWVKDLMVNGHHAEILWEKSKQTTSMLNLCPDPCSYFSDQDFEFKQTDSSCEMQVTLNVLCSQPRDGLSFQATGSLNVTKSCEMKK